MSLSETMDALNSIRQSSVMSSQFFVEAVAYQRAAIEEFERRAFAVAAMHPIKDKRARLISLRLFPYQSATDSIFRFSWSRIL
jgi:hypothetical protein